ncbi:theronine dehydrogenase [Deinococcus sp. HMF7620]|uniref:Theronine dehydrogenase n=1 Tax=Deinococcus arboris TaxID=2682977 RepID=A0A7C9HPV4_9DEIO|nr:theronine dehydrogenase [Deinococcus arboris]MVN85547.1 theronine dehydrogenase [Deinococcus arboris]
MRLVAHAPNRLRWDAVPDRPPGPGEVSVRTHFSALSVASELTLLHAGPFPAALGYQTLGTVEAVGAGVTLALGTRVVTTLGHASHGFHPAGRVVPVPPHVSDRAALCAILGEETHKGLRKVRPRPGEAVLVAGAGLLGLLSIFNLTRRGVHEVHLLEPRADRRALALTFGAAAHAPGELPHDRFQVGVECSASPAGFTELVSHLAPGGRCVVLSDGNGGALSLPPAFHQREVQVVGSSDGEDYAAYAHWLWAHAEPRLDHLFPLTVRPADLPGLYSQLQARGRPVSAVVDWRGALG